MDTRLKNLEDLSELITKEIVQQNKSMIDTNKNLLCEIKSLREAFVKQDEDFEEFKNLLKKIYDLNKQQGLPTIHQQQYPHTAHSNPQLSTQSSVSNQMPPSFSLNNLLSSGGPNNLNNSLYMSEQQQAANQSMLNNLSFQSERTPSNMNQQNPNASCYSIPSSASAMMFNQQQQHGTQYTPNIYNQMAPNVQQQKPSYQQIPTVKQPQQQQQFLSGVVSSGSGSFKSLPQGVYQQQQQLQPPPVMQQQVQTAQVAKPFSFGSLNKPPVNGTDSVKLEQQRQIFSTVPTQITSTPQPPSQTFPTSKSTQEVKSNKPPTFQFSPTKQPEAPKPFGSMLNTTPSATPSIFGSNLFKTTPASVVPTKTPEKKTESSIFGLIKAPEPVRLEDEGDEGTGGNPEEFEPQGDFKPIVKLQSVETKTGEEDEEVLLKQRCKLFRFDLSAKDWKEKGLGDIKFLKNKKTGVIRILMRREQIFKICANHRISPGMTIKEIAPKQYSWSAIDFSEGNEGKTEVLLARFKLAEEGIAFKNEFEKSVEASKSLSTTNTPVKSAEKPQDKVDGTITNKLSQLLKTDKWNCTGCYAPNNKDDLKCICCQAMKPGHTADELPKSTTPIKAPTSQFSFGLKPSGDQKQVSPAKGTSAFSFGAKPVENVNMAKPFSFESLAKAASPAKSGAGLFASKPGTSFGDLAAAAPTSKPTFGVSGEGFNKPDTVKPLFGSVFQVPQASPATPINPDEEDTTTENPEEYEPQTDFKPIVKLDKVETKTGEEDEDILFKARCKLFRFEKTTNEWKEKGLGEMKVLRHKQHHNMHRILMRRDQVLKLCANHRITSELTFEIFNDKQVRWHAEDYSEGTGKHELLAARFKHEQEAKEFKKACEDALEILKTEPHETKKPEQIIKPDSCIGLKSTLSEMFKNDSKWNCQACYAPNSSEVVKCVCCNALKPGAIEPVVDKSLTSAIGKISFGTPVTSGVDVVKTVPVIFGSAPAVDKSKDEKVKFDFGSKPMFGGAKVVEAVSPGQSVFGAGMQGKSLFGAPTQTSFFGSTSPKVDPASIFGAKSGSTFADIATKTQATGFGGGFTGFGQATGQPKPLFGQTPTKPIETTQNEDESNGPDTNPEEYEPQVDFKPLVKLQEVETKTGEEDEDILFKQRCKLFRFDQEKKEWREKGVGDIKILKHKIKENTYRVLMRRDQVLKLCANHRISPTLKLEKVTDKQLTWYVQDCSEDEPHTEILLAKFRHEEEATNFKNEFERIQKILLENPTTMTTPSKVPEKKVQISNKLASLVAKDSWKCSGCLTVNKSAVNKCVCCELERTGVESDSVVIIKTVEATKEQIEKARQFQLPDNFYLYENCKDCTGCRGCEKESN